jgi:hypothetical protein
MTFSENREVVLMTATIDAGTTPFVEIKSQQERLFEYLCSLIAWIKLTNIKTIIFCENSNTSYDFGLITNFAKNEGKVLEVLVFDGNHEAHQYGKGYGEGKIIEYAINHSKNLNDNVDFYKITGRIFVQNFDIVQKVHAGIDNVFNKPLTAMKIDKFNLFQGLSLIIQYFIGYLLFLKARGWRGPYNPFANVSTVFYKSNVSFFKKNLINSYKKVNDKKLYTIECAYYYDLLQNDFSPFLTDYQLVGRSGASGMLISGLDYTDDIKKMAKTFM